MKETAFQTSSDGLSKIQDKSRNNPWHPFFAEQGDWLIAFGKHERRSFFYIFIHNVFARHAKFVQLDFRVLHAVQMLLNVACIVHRQGKVRSCSAYVAEAYEPLNSQNSAPFVNLCKSFTSSGFNLNLFLFSWFKYTTMAGYKHNYMASKKSLSRFKYPYGELFFTFEQISMHLKWATHWVLFTYKLVQYDLY